MTQQFTKDERTPVLDVFRLTLAFSLGAGCTDRPRRYPREDSFRRDKAFFRADGQKDGKAKAACR